MFCPECGTENRSKFKFCKNCGKNLHNSQNEILMTKTTKTKQKKVKKKDRGFFAPEKSGIDKGVLGGCIMMGIAVIWFIGGLSVDIVFFYPPILFIIGLYAFIKGLVTGNISGNKHEHV